MAKSDSKIQDSISVEVNGETQEDGVKGPAEDRLANHDEEVAAFEKRLKAEAKAEQKAEKSS